jgi:hypothetical protein
MSKTKNLREMWQECYDGFDLLFADGFDEAIIGVDVVQMRVCYDVDKCISILRNEHGMDLEDAIEYFDFNVSGAYVGEQTPLYIKTNTSYYVN